MTGTGAVEPAGAPAGPREADGAAEIAGTSAAEIAGSVRSLIERGRLGAGDALPPVRTLADRLGVNRNTATAAYRQLRDAGLVVASGRGGTRVAAPTEVAREGFASPAADLCDVGNGNPDPALIPSPEDALGAVLGRPVLYGAPVIDPDLAAWARDWLSADLAAADIRISVTNGAADALERLLSGSLSRGDAVAIEDPGFLTGIHTIRVGGFEAVGVAVDDEGLTPGGLRAALEAGARAVICTPRAQNPTGASVSHERARALRAVLADYPYALVIEDDHFSLLSRRPFRSIVPAGHRRFALVRSVSKFLGPDMSLALVASDPHTAERLGLRLRPGTAWVSHLLQRLSLALLTDHEALADVERAGEHYAARNRAFCDRLAEHGIVCEPGDGLNVWVPVREPSVETAARLREAGWLVRAGDDFRSGDAPPAGRSTAASTSASDAAANGAALVGHIRVTAHLLNDTDQTALAAAIAG
ncbi:aminotransferase class I/II-fold pyridoxal phosphate-dependent enzyme [Microbacterium halophytorum]|uniref:aminotransferase class I/II-fold pyridoxal phosphate-dependent enzyme n=1 Tax=Microbacterium halophytorum TaxID=2067568 RepID=UPI000CFDF07E|nr:aminotransferase class I/II-fold pyridoxal phosphate-dependent enzyme [Microbacterium halophytorum]